ncbi:MAG: hypothetical protein IJG64_00325 [Oscillospiraceae bacterium]|nr:hypothetical protein [Oscillospiraceae bacterium]
MDNNDLRRQLEEMSRDTATLPMMQKYIDDMVHVRGFADETPLEVMLLILEETGELAKEVRKSHSRIKNDTSKQSKTSLESEVGDVFSMLLALCRTVDVDLFTAFRNKELDNCGRHWE